MNAFSNPDVPHCGDPSGGQVGVDEICSAHFGRSFLAGGLRHGLRAEHISRLKMVKRWLQLNVWRHLLLSK